MALSQQKFREMVFQLLYSYDLGRPSEPEMISLLMEELAVSKRNVKLAQERAQQILSKLAEIDPLIKSVAVSYAFERIQSVTKNILRLGVFELFFDDTIPPKVAIAEAMRLSRKFANAESASFVNALLDHLYQASRGHTISAQALEESSQALLQSETLDEQTLLELKKQVSETEDQQ